MSDNDKCFPDDAEVPYRGAGPAASMTLIAAVGTPPPGTWIVEIPFTDADVIPDAEDDLAQEGNGED